VRDAHDHDDQHRHGHDSTTAVASPTTTTTPRFVDNGDGTITDNETDSSGKRIPVR
jgi:hypothetical protein